MVGKLFKRKYRIDTIRHPGWDYSWDGEYFITICTKNQLNYLGNIKDSRMYLSKIGKTAEIFWQNIPKHYPFVIVDEFVIMPNHIHGILIIKKQVETHNYASKNNRPNDQMPMRSVQRNPKNKEHHFTYKSDNKTQNIFAPQSQNLSAVLRGYKSAVKAYATKKNINFCWQDRFYDRIIRDGDEYDRIKVYIQKNVENWEYDKLYNKNPI